MRSICVSLCLGILGLGLLAGGGYADAKPKVLTGHAKGVDGDTLVLNGTKIRLFGVDAFEWNQTCGKFNCGAQADKALDLLIASGNISCERQATDPYGRTVAICKTSSGVDIGSSMVRQGLAVAYRAFSLNYLSDEQYAKAHRAGAWAYGFQSPVQFRRSQQ